MIALGLIYEEFVRCQVRANETYSEAKHQFSVRNIDVLMNVSVIRCSPLISGGPLLRGLSHPSKKFFIIALIEKYVK